MTSGSQVVRRESGSPVQWRGGSTGLAMQSIDDATRMSQ